MEQLGVGELKTHFSDIIQRILKGEEFTVVYGKSKRPVANLRPYRNTETGERKLGRLKGKIKVAFKGQFDITNEELLNLK